MRALLRDSAYVFPNPSRGHAIGTNGVRTPGDLGDIAFPSRGAGCHNRSSPCSGAPGMTRDCFEPGSALCGRGGLAIASGDGFAAVVSVCAGRGDRFFADLDIEILRFV
jgi:hypothetical protein